ncbi:MAG: tetratricopeptide repeat protein [Actinomycetaceae bacterium]|nr:tetratricopeptide repeat protein [Actinomycetaceae bacterium]
MESNQWISGARPALEKASALLDIGRNEAALKELSTITSTDSSVLHEANLYRAQACINLGQKEDAFRYAKECIRHNPRSFRGHLMLGVIEDQRNRLGPALKALEEARNLAPHVAVVHQRLGMVYSQLNRPVEARKAVQQALSLAPHDPDSHYTVGYIELNSNMGDRTIAEEALCRTLSIDPQHRGAVILLGHLRGEQTGDISERVRGLVEAQKMDPRDPIVVAEFDGTFRRIVFFNTLAIFFSYILFQGIFNGEVGRGLFIIGAHGATLIYILFQNFFAHVRGNPQGWKYLVKGLPRRRWLAFTIFVGQFIAWILMLSGGIAYVINNQVNLQPLNYIIPILIFPLVLIVALFYGGRFLLSAIQKRIGGKGEK